jgi:hypothetical protein
MSSLKSLKPSTSLKAIGSQKTQPAKPPLCIYCKNLILYKKTYPSNRELPNAKTLCVNFLDSDCPNCKRKSYKEYINTQQPSKEEKQKAPSPTYTSSKAPSPTYTSNKAKASSPTYTSSSKAKVPSYKAPSPTYLKQTSGKAPSGKPILPPIKIPSPKKPTDIQERENIEVQPFVEEKTQEVIQNVVLPFQKPPPKDHEETTLTSNNVKLEIEVPSHEYQEETCTETSPVESHSSMFDWWYGRFSYGKK